MGPLLFLIYINDFRFSITNSISRHFADEIKSLDTELNFDFKLCSEWLKANRVSLNVDKSKFISRRVINYEKCSIKLNGRKSVPTDYVK